MSEQPLRIANGAGFLGDNLDAPRSIVESCEVDFLTLEYLAELTLSILARQREKNPAAGYAADFLDVLKSLLPQLAAQPQLRIVTNAGGMNPASCAAAAARILTDAGMSGVVIGVVAGDDLLPRISELQANGCEFSHLDSGQPLSELNAVAVCANAYLGARPIAEALQGGARIVITGRVADASLTVGPAADHFGWRWDDWNRLAAASVAGHLIECGAQVTGGYSTDWQDRELGLVGYPIAELDERGAAVITKPTGSGGVVNRQTVAEQLIYEIGDPSHYLTPDVDVDFTGVEIAEVGIDRVAVTGAIGRPAPDDFKVSLAYRDGFTASGQLLVYGRDCREKARACAEMVFQRVARAGFELESRNIERLGTGDGVPNVSTEAGSSPREVMLRIAVHDSRREAVERFTKEIAPLVTSGPAGLAGYAVGRSPVREVFSFWPTLVSRDFVQPRMEVQSAGQWAERENP